jgi:PAS domain-containing protein
LHKISSQAEHRELARHLFEVSASCQLLASYPDAIIERYRCALNHQTISLDCMMTQHAAARASDALQFLLGSDVLLLVFWLPLFRRSVGAESILGFPREAVIGAPLSQLLPAAMVQDFLKSLPENLATVLSHKRLKSVSALPALTISQTVPSQAASPTSLKGAVAFASQLSTPAAPLTFSMTRDVALTSANGQLRTFIVTLSAMAYGGDAHGVGAHVMLVASMQDVTRLHPDQEANEMSSPRPSTSGMPEAITVAPPAVAKSLPAHPRFAAPVDPTYLASLNQSLMENGATPCLILSNKGNVVQANAPAAAALGYSSADELRNAEPNIRQFTAGATGLYRHFPEDVAPTTPRSMTPRTPRSARGDGPPRPLRRTPTHEQLHKETEEATLVLLDGTVTPPTRLCLSGLRGLKGPQGYLLTFPLPSAPAPPKPATPPPAPVPVAPVAPPPLVEAPKTPRVMLPNPEPSVTPAIIAEIVCQTVDAYIRRSRPNTPEPRLTHRSPSPDEDEEKWQVPQPSLRSEVWVVPSERRVSENMLPPALDTGAETPPRRGLLPPLSPHGHEPHGHPAYHEGAGDHPADVESRRQAYMDVSRKIPSQSRFGCCERSVDVEAECRAWCRER